MKHSIIILGIAGCLVLPAGCTNKVSEEGTKPKVELSPEDQQLLLEGANKFNTLLSTDVAIHTIKTTLQKSDKVSFLLNFLSPTLETAEKRESAKSILESLFKVKGSPTARIAEQFSVSKGVSQHIEKLSANLKAGVRKATEKKLSATELSANLKLVLLEFKKEVQSSTVLTFDEMRTLTGIAEFQYQTIEKEAMIINSLGTNMANTGGRIQSWFSDLWDIVVVAVTAAVVVAAVVASAGLAIGLAAAAYGTAVAIGAGVGFTYGAVMGYYYSSQGYCPVDLNFGNIEGAFYDWSVC